MNEEMNSDKAYSGAEAKTYFNPKDFEYAKTKSKVVLKVLTVDKMRQFAEIAANIRKKLLEKAELL